MAKRNLSGDWLLHCISSLIVLMTLFMLAHPFNSGWLTLLAQHMFEFGNLFLEFSFAFCQIGLKYFVPLLQEIGPPGRKLFRKEAILACGFVHAVAGKGF